MKRLPLLLLLLLPLVCSAAADEPCTLQLYVVSEEDGEPLPGVLCRLLDADDTLLHYVLTDADGYATLALPKTADHLTLSMMSYRSVILREEKLDCSESVEIRMRPEATVLPEVMVKSPPVAVYRDTVTYQVEAFQAESDRTIGDVLRKLPGVEVGKEGGIKYQGKAISHLYIEGQDLLDSRYNLATRNLPVQAVRDIQVMEHHTHERVLQDKTRSDDVAMNLLLNESHKARPFGEATLGLGAAPIVAEGKVSATLVHPHRQTMLLAEGNNLGVDVEQLYGGTSLTYGLLYTPFPITPLLSPAQGSEPPLPQQRYLMNESGATSLNHLIALSQVNSLRLNATGILDRRTRDDLQQNSFGGSEPWEYLERAGRERRFYDLSPSLFLEHNAESAYLSDKLTGDFSHHCLRSDVKTEERESVTNLTEERSIQDLSLTNDLQTIFETGDLIYRGDLYTSLQELSESITLSDSPAESYRHRRGLLHAGIRTTKSLGEVMLTLSAKGDGEVHQFRITDDCRMTLRFGTVGVTPEALYRFPSDKFRITLLLPVSYVSYDSHEVSRRLWALEPDLKLTYEPTNRSTISLSGALREKLRTPMFLSPRPLRTGYRSSVSYPDVAERVKTGHLALNATYRNLLYMIFANGTLMWQRTGRERVGGLTLTDGQLIYTSVPYAHQSDLIYGGISLSKSFISIGTALKGTADVTHSVTPVLQNEELYEVPFTYVNLALSMEQRLGKVGNLLYTIGQGLSHRSIDEGDGSTLGTLTQRATLYLTPTKRCEASLSYEGGRSEISKGQQVRYHFLDASLQFDVTEKWRLRLEGKNLLNSSTYSLTEYDKINYFAYELPLRGRTIFLTATYNF